MDMWMDLEILSPGMQNTEESDFSAEMFGIGSNFEQCCGTGVKQKVVNDLLVIQRQPGEFVRDGEDNVHVLHGQQFLAASGEPLVTRVGLALRTMPRAAGVERGGLEAALATAVQMSAEHSRAAMLDGEQDAEM